MALLNSPERDERYCRTHAFAARLFAAYATGPSNADAWTYVARSWEALAALSPEVA